MMPLACRWRLFLGELDAGDGVGAWILHGTWGQDINALRSQPREVACRGHRVCSISAGCSHLARRLSGPPLECMRECTHFVKAEQPRNLGYMQLVVIEVPNGQIAPQLLKYFSEVQPFVRKLSGQRPLAHSQTRATSSTATLP
jgi:hypothetical protein